MNQLIVEAGSSKSDWLVFSEGIVNEEFTTAGINPSTQSRTTILANLRLACQKLNIHSIIKVFYYGAGCKGIAAIVIQEMLQYLLPQAEIHVYSDLLAAARSSCQGQAGIIAILGTGSHSCVSDGHQITESKPSLGFLLGDEGSGNSYGKKILRSYFYGELDEALKNEFETVFPFVREEYLSRLYSSPQISKELAQFFPFLIEHKKNKYVQSIIVQGVNEFYNSRLEQYEKNTALPIHLAGSVALALKEEYTDLLTYKGYREIKFNPKPMEGLLKYHLHYANNS